MDSQQQAFTQWLIGNVINGNSHIGNLFTQGTPQNDYDLQSYYKYSRALNPPVKGQGGLHLTDLYKLPNHPTFSNESAYATGPSALLAGRWQDGPTPTSAFYLPSMGGLMNGKRPTFERW